MGEYMMTFTHTFIQMTGDVDLPSTHPMQNLSWNPHHSEGSSVTEVTLQVRGS